MLVKITNKCGMGCSHCMENSTPAGLHMTEELFDASLEFSWKIEEVARKTVGYKCLLLSGGEATEHPDVIKYIQKTYARGFSPMLITNGMWLDNKELRDSILRPEWKDLFVQVTNDSRFYPRKPKTHIEDKRIVYVDSLIMMMPLGRFENKVHKELRNRSAPSSFNVRSATRRMGDVRLALEFIRARTALGMSGHCHPSISSDGSFMAGETSKCYVAGNVYSTMAEVTESIIRMQCNYCKLEDNLTPAQKFAIGAYTPTVY